MITTIHSKNTFVFYYISKNFLKQLQNIVYSLPFLTSVSHTFGSLLYMFPLCKCKDIGYIVEAKPKKYIISLFNCLIYFSLLHKSTYKNAVMINKSLNCTKQYINITVQKFQFNSLLLVYSQLSIHAQGNDKMQTAF